MGAAVEIPRLDLSHRAHFAALLNALSQYDRAALVDPAASSPRSGVQLRCVRASRALGPFLGTRHTSALRFTRRRAVDARVRRVVERPAVGVLSRRAPRPRADGISSLVIARRSASSRRAWAAISARTSGGSSTSNGNGRLARYVAMKSRSPPISTVVVVAPARGGAGSRRPSGRCRGPRRRAAPGSGCAPGCRRPARRRPRRRARRRPGAGRSALLKPVATGGPTRSTRYVRQSSRSRSKPTRYQRLRSETRRCGSTWRRLVRSSPVR